MLMERFEPLPTYLRPEELALKGRGVLQNCVPSPFPLCAGREQQMPPSEGRAVSVLSLSISPISG